MIITKKYAERLVAAGKATKESTVLHNEERYQVVTRHDKLRVDHYKIEVES